MATRGKYIVIEGHDGTGKSAQRDLLTERLKNERGIDVIHTIEPGGTPISNQIRLTIKDGTLSRDALTNVLLFTASRRESWQQVVEPALAAGKWVIADRSYYSTIVYQGYGEGADIDLIKDVTRDFVAPEYLTPDIAVILALQNETERQRRAAQSADTEQDTFEQKDTDFQQRVTEGYLRLAKDVKAFAVSFSATDSKQAVSNMIWDTIKDAL